MNSSKFSKPAKRIIILLRTGYRSFAKRMNKTRWAILLIVIGVVIIALWRHHVNSARRMGPSVSVVAAVAQARDIPVYLSALGTVTSTYTVTMKTQVSGLLTQVLFREGQKVKKNQLLAVVDPEPFQAALMQAEGQLMRDRALLVNAKMDLKRYKTLWRQDSVSKQTLDTQASLVKQLQGTIKLDEGLVKGARANLDDCYIISPIDGRVGLRLVDPGNFVQPSDPNGVVVVNMLNPIMVIFPIPEDDIPQVVDEVHAGNILKVEAYDRTQQRLLATGKLFVIDNQIDPTTGTVKLKAQFQNENDRLFPNQFVNVKLLVKILHDATVIPTAAIQHGAQGDYVYLIRDDQTVTAKLIKVGVTSGEDTAVTAGVLSDQSVVVEGVDKLAEGSRITIANAFQRRTAQ